MGLQITILESAQLGVTIVEPFNVTLTPTAPATIDIEVGVPGAAATVTVGTTTTLAPGLNATVTNVGTSTNAILDFGIPAGEQGIQGIQGIPGPQGTSGVIYATAPLSYNAGTQTISINLSAYATQSFVTSQGYITASALTPYLTSATAAATYYPLTNPSNFITVSALAGYATESWVTSQNYLTTADLTGYATESWVTSQGYITDAPSDGETYARKNATWEIIGGGSYLPLAGGTMDANATIVLSTATYDSLVSGEVFGVELTADPTQNASLGFNAVTVQDGAGSMQMRADGLTFPDATTQTTAGLTDAPSDTYGYVRKDGAWSYSTKFYEVQVGAWTNITSGQYLIADGSFVTNITAADIILSNAAGVGMRLTDASITFADATVQSTAGLSPATAATTYAPIAAAVPVGGSTGQVLAKTSGTDYALSWTTPAVGDKYYTTSTTSLAVSNGTKSLTVGTGLSYTTQQSIVVAYDPTHHMHGVVTSYNSSTGAMVVDIQQHTGSGTYASWTVNVGGISSVAEWGTITGTLSSQTDLQSALDAKLSVTTAASTYAPLASPTFTGDPKAPTPATGDNDTSIATTAFVKNQGYVTSSYVASTYYPLTNPSNFVIPNGTTSIQVTGGTVRSIDGSDNFVSLDGSALNFGNGSTISGLSVTGTGITYADSTVQTTAGIGDAPSDSQTYGRNNGAWTVVSGGSGSGTLTYSSPYIYDTVTASNITALDLTSGSLNASTVTGGNAQMDSTGLTLAASSGAVITFADATTQSTAGMLTTDNLSGLANTATARTNLGLGTMAVETATNYALKASPTFTGTPLSTTAAADTNTTQIATTAYVVGQASSTTPAATGTAAVGTSLKYARADHVHANPLPTGGTTGQVLSKVDGTNYNVQWSTAGGGGGGVDIQTFGSSSSSGSFTWTKPAGAKWVEFYLFGAGAGGGAGMQNVTTAARSGGGGGGAGSVCYGIISANNLASQETVVVATGGAGGTPQASGSNGGSPANPSSNTTFYSFRAVSGNSGNGGSTTTSSGGAGRIWSFLYANTAAQAGGGAGNTSTGGNVNSYAGNFTIPMPGGGGSGAAASSTTLQNGGQAGGHSVVASTSGLNVAIAAGSNGIASTNTAATAGTSATTNYTQGGTGGGGGFYKTATGGSVLNGGAGGWPGGGGGGGGASDNGFTSGAGGAGANGFAVIITYF